MTSAIDASALSRVIAIVSVQARRAGIVTHDPCDWVRPPVRHEDAVAC